MKLFFLTSLVSATPFSDWLREEKANGYISASYFACYGLNMPLVNSDREVISLVGSTGIGAPSVTLAKVKDGEDMSKIRCGDVAYALSKMDPVNVDMTEEELKTVTAPFLELLKTAAALRRSNYGEWIAQSQLNPEFAAAKGPEGIPFDYFSKLGYTPFEMAEEKAKKRLDARIDSADANGCRDLHVPGLEASIWARSGLFQFIDVYWRDIELELRPNTDIGSLTCRELLDVISQIDLLEGLPKDVFELRETLRDPSKSDDRTTKSGGFWVTLSDGSKIMSDAHSLDVFCRPFGKLSYSSANMEYEDKPRAFSPKWIVSEVCDVFITKVEKLDDMINGMVAV